MTLIIGFFDVVILGILAIGAWIFLQIIWANKIGRIVFTIIVIGTSLALFKYFISHG